MNTEKKRYIVTIMSDLTRYLKELESQAGYRIDKTLKVRDVETTEVVFFCGADGGELGPFVRKRIQLGTGIGNAYMRLYEAQKNGARFHSVPSIVSCITTESELIVVMEFAAGKPLQTLIEEEAGSRDMVFRVFPQICTAVIELHTWDSQPLIHRDLKPSNIIVSDFGVCLIDFGIARYFNPQVSVDTTLFGTQGYAPPEQFGYEQTDVTADVYALGVILYELFSGSLPTAENRRQYFSHPFVPEEIRQVIVHACAFAPGDRYQSVKALKEDFDQAVAVVLSNEPFFSSTPIPSHVSTPAPVAHPVSQSAPALEYSPPPPPAPVKPSWFGRIRQQSGRSVETTTSLSTSLGSTPTRLHSGVRGVGEQGGLSYVSHSVLSQLIQKKDAFLSSKKGIGRCIHLVGVVWNSILLLFGALLLMGGVASSFDPDPDVWPGQELFFVRAIVYFFIICGFIAPLLYMVAYKKPLKFFLKPWFRLPWYARFGILLLLVFLSICAIGALQMATKR